MPAETNSFGFNKLNPSTESFLISLKNLHNHTSKSKNAFTLATDSSIESNRISKACVDTIFLGSF